MTPPIEKTMLTLGEITKEMRETFQNFIDPRTGKNKMYSMVDAALSAFSIFFMQSPSFLEYQRTLEQTHGRNNAHSLFGTHEIPSDNQIRNLLDHTPPTAVEPMFTYIFNKLNDVGLIEKYRSRLGKLLLILDGTEYFSSKTIHCECCSTKRHANGSTTYHHSALTPVLVKADCDQVIPLFPEFIQPQDGAGKQDCELNAAKRWLAANGEKFAQLGTLVGGDDLYSREPLCLQLLELKLDFIFVCKPSSHPTTQEWLDFLESQGTIRHLTRRRWTGKRHETDTYRYVNEVPLRDGEDALKVNWCEITTVNDKGKVLYQNSFITSLAINEQNVIEMIQAGRNRWKIENENNNILKTKGYHFEHNYGHGKHFLSSLLATLIILAFLIHTVLEWMDSQYQLLRQKAPTRGRFFEDIRILTSYLYFNSWNALMEFMLQSFNSHAKPLESG